jgi:uncharacterized protein (DUF2249 family)
MLAAGDHPVNLVMDGLGKLPAGEIFKVTASFVPVPLIDKASGPGLVHWVKQEEEHSIVFFRKEDRKSYKKAGRIISICSLSRPWRDLPLFCRNIRNVNVKSASFADFGCE